MRALAFVLTILVAEHFHPEAPAQRRAQRSSGAQYNRAGPRSAVGAFYGRGGRQFSRSRSSLPLALPLSLPSSSLATGGAFVGGNFRTGTIGATTPVIPYNGILSTGASGVIPVVPYQGIISTGTQRAPVYNGIISTGTQRARVYNGIISSGTIRSVPYNGVQSLARPVSPFTNSQTILRPTRGFFPSGGSINRFPQPTPFNGGGINRGGFNGGIRAMPRMQRGKIIIVR